MACLALVACGTSRSDVEAGTDTGTPHKTTCSPACGASEVCKEPGACPWNAECIPLASVTCPEAGLCSAPSCAGELDAGVLRCVCR
jgi:hypothetical protein